MTIASRKRRWTKAELRDQLADRYAEWYIKHPPKDDFELDEFIRHCLGFTVPKKAVCSGHVAPFQFVSDLYFERVSKAIGFANRTGGKTLNLAIVNFCDMLFKEGCETTHAGATLAQANRCYQYVRSFVFMRRFQKYFPKCTLGATQSSGGSSLEILTGTVKGLSSPHPQKSRIDEVELIDWTTLQTGLSMTVSRGEVKAQDVFTSTRKFGVGTMQRLLDEAEDLGIAVYPWCWREMVRKCTRKCKGDPRYGDCPAYERCQGDAHKSEGYYAIDDFINKAVVLSDDAWESEWNCTKPSDVLLVYGEEFNENENVWDWDQLYKAYPFDPIKKHVIPKNWQRLGAIDFGASPGHPFVCLKGAVAPDGTIVFYYEYYEEQLKLIKDHAETIKASSDYQSGELMWADWDRQDRAELSAQRIPTFAADKDVLNGINDVKEFLRVNPMTKKPGLIVMRHLRNTIREFKSYRWQETDEGKPSKEKPPLKLNDHAMDAARYMLRSWKKGLTGKVRMSKASFVNA